MNLWIIKYDTDNFSQDYINRLKDYVADIPQLSTYEENMFSNHNFHFLSLSAANMPKKYNSLIGEEISGYSGLLIDKSSECRDLRDIVNVNVLKPYDYYGQFALYHLKEDFIAHTDVLGFHKVFYGEKDGIKYVSNAFEFIKKLGVFEVCHMQMLKDFSTVRFGIYPGYNTLLKNVYTLPEYGTIKITAEGNIKLDSYKDIRELLLPKGNFEEKLKETVSDYRTIASYLMKYHHTAIGLSGGFDGRLILNMFSGTDKSKLETFTYNRAGNLDLIIASILSKKARVSHKKFVLDLKNKKLDVEVAIFKDSSKDAFNSSLKDLLKNFYKKDDKEFKVVLGGNGGDTDWEFGEKKIADVDKTTIQSFIRDYVLKMAKHPLLKDSTQKSIANDLENYLLDKYSLFATQSNWQQLLASAFFHLERFRGQQGFIYSQNSNKNHDVFVPFAIESFNQLVFLSNKNQLQRGLREGIQYRLSEALTKGKIPYAPILTSANDHGNNVLQKALNKVAPYLPKIIWKINKGDTNTRIRKQYQSQSNEIYKQYILDNKHSDIFVLINKELLISEVSKADYNGSYNPIGSMIKTIEESKSL